MTYLVINVEGLVT